jgi:rhodanese-related sulfurtransferase
MIQSSIKKLLPLTLVALLFAGTIALPTAARAESDSVESVKGAETIDVKKAKELFDAGALFVDSRSKSAFETGRIPGAESVPLSKTPTSADYDTVKASLEKLSAKDKPVIMYCNGIKCPLSGMMAEKAIEWGYTKVYYFRTGFPAWKEAGYAVE